MRTAEDALRNLIQLRRAEMLVIMADGYNRCVCVFLSLLEHQHPQSNSTVRTFLLSVDNLASTLEDCSWEKTWF